MLAGYFTAQELANTDAVVVSDKDPVSYTHLVEVIFRFSLGKFQTVTV